MRRIVRNLYWYNKSFLKGKGISITEHLTAYDLELLSACKAVYGFHEVWTDQCVIYANVDGEKKKITTKAQLVYLTGDTNHAISDPFYDFSLRSRSSVPQSVATFPAANANINKGTNNRNHGYRSQGRYKPRGRGGYYRGGRGWNNQYHNRY